VTADVRAWIDAQLKAAPKITETSARRISAALFQQVTA
jgi:hypothetical protein